MPTKIDKDFQPSDRVYELLATLFGPTTPEHNLEESKAKAKEFCGQNLGEFMMYWEGITGKAAAKSNWDSTFYNRMKAILEYKKDAMARNRTYGGQQENAFAKVLDNIQNVPNNQRTNDKPRPINPQLQPIAPKDLGTMSADEGLAALRKFIK